MSIFVGRAVGGGGQLLDVLQVRQAIAALADPEKGMQLRALYGARSHCRPRNVILPGNDLDGLVRAVEGMADASAIYYGINPVPATLVPPPGRGAKVPDILYRRWLLVDVDPNKPDEFRDHSATDAEHEHTRAEAFAILDFLAGLDWPSPVIVDSGNGNHLLYRIDLPNDDHGRVLAKGLLIALGDKFDTDGAHVGRECHDATRIAKLPGTWAKKGPNLADRPHRLCKLEFCPFPPPEPITGAMIQQAIATLQGDSPEARPAAPEPTPSAFVGRAPSADLNGEVRRTTAYGRSALQREQAKVALAVPGGRNDQLFKSCAAMGELIAGGVVAETDVVEAMREAAARCRLHEDPGCGSSGIEATIRSGIEKGKTQPRGLPQRQGHTANGTPGPPAAADGEEASIIVRASSITPKRVEWLWPYRIPLNKLTTFAGVGGLGKTFVLCDIAARVSQGGDWPDSQGECCEPGQVLFLSGEDDPDDTLVPRLIELGANLDRICFLTPAVQDRFTLDDLDTFDKALRQIGDNPPVRLVVIDPPACFLGDADDHKNAEVRALLTPLKNWAIRNHLAVVFNTHFNKPTGGKVDAAMRVMGSVAWVNAVRSAHIFARDPEDADRVLFVPLKTNIGKRKNALAFTIKPLENDLATVTWLGEVDTTADEAAGKEKVVRKRDIQAAEWLEEVFATVDKLTSNDIWARKRSETKISDDALREGKDLLGIRALQDTNPDGGKCWWWHWTSDARSRWTERKARMAAAQAANRETLPDGDQECIS